MSRSSHPVVGANTQALASLDRDRNFVRAPLIIKKLTSAAQQFYGHKLGKRYSGMSVQSTNPSGYEKYLFVVNSANKETFIRLGSTTAVTVTFTINVF